MKFEVHSGHRGLARLAARPAIGAGTAAGAVAQVHRRPDPRRNPHCTPVRRAKGFVRNARTQPGRRLTDVGEGHPVDRGAVEAARRRREEAEVGDEAALEARAELPVDDANGPRGRPQDLPASRAGSGRPRTSRRSRTSRGASAGPRGARGREPRSSRRERGQRSAAKSRRLGSPRRRRRRTRRGRRPGRRRPGSPRTSVRRRVDRAGQPLERRPERALPATVERVRALGRPAGDAVVAAPRRPLDDPDGRVAPAVGLDDRVDERHDVEAAALGGRRRRGRRGAAGTGRGTAGGGRTARRRSRSGRAARLAAGSRAAPPRPRRPTRSRAKRSASDVASGSNETAADSPRVVERRRRSTAPSPSSTR